MQHPDNYEYLRKLALDSGAMAAAVIPADQIVVEDRVRMKCTVGCPNYGTSLKCPPHVPSPDDLRKVLKEYHYALVVMHRPFSPPADLAAEDLALKAPAPGKSLESVVMTQELRACLAARQNEALAIMLELEKAAFNGGSPLAIALTGGKCKLCDECNVKEGVCRHPVKARIAAEALGVNLVRTAENAGMSLKFPADGSSGPVMILLID